MTQRNNNAATKSDHIVKDDTETTNPNSITGIVYLGNVLTAVAGSVVFEGQGIISATILSNKNNNLELEIELETFEDVMICDAPGVQDTNLIDGSGTLDIVLKDNTNTTKFIWCVRVIQPYQDVSPDITLSFNFVKRGIA